MSKVIKSFLANNLEKEQRTIALKEIFQEQMVEVVSFRDNETTEDTISKNIELQRAFEEAEKLRIEAREEYEQFQKKMSEEIIANQKQAEELYIQAETNGYNEGYQQGLEVGQKQYDASIQDAKNVVAASKKDYLQRLEEAEPIIIELATKIAEKVIARKVIENQDYWISLVKEVINEVREQENVKLYIHPDWYETTLAHKEELRLLLPNCEALYIYPDVHCQENGCTIETPYGKIDASVDSQLNEIKHALLEKLKELGGNEGS